MAVSRLARDGELTETLIKGEKKIRLIKVELGIKYILSEIPCSSVLQALTLVLCTVRRGTDVIFGSNLLFGLNTIKYKSNYETKVKR